jgi:hypothetical protein
VRPSTTRSVSRGFATFAHLFDLGHQLLVDREPARGVEHVNVVTAERRLGLCAARDLDRRLALDDGERVDPDLRAEDRELLHRRGAVRVERGHEDALAVPLLQALGELRRRRRLAAALQAHHQDRRGRVVDLELARIVVVAGKDMDKLVMHDLDHLLARRDRFRHGLARGLALHRRHEIARNGQRHVGLEERDPDLAERGLHVLVRQRTLLGQPVEDAGETFGEVFEHGPRLLPPVAVQAPCGMGRA